MTELFREAIRRIEPYVPGKPIETLQRELGEGVTIVKLASNENPLGMSTRAREAVALALTTGQLYPDDSCLALREKLAGRLGVGVENIRFGNGSSELIYMLGVALLTPGDNIVMSRYSFNLPKIVAHIFGCGVNVVEMHGNRHDLDAMLAAIDAHTRFVYLDTPTNPLGSAIERREFEQFVEQLPAHVVLVCDEAYREFAADEYVHDTIGLIREGRNVVTLRTFSKLHGLAGLRVGYCVSTPSIVEGLTKVSMPFAVNSLAQVAASASLDDEMFVRRTLDLNASQKAGLCSFLDAQGISYVPSHTNFVAMDLGPDAPEVCRRLELEGVIVRSLKGYGLETMVRVTLGTPHMNRRFMTSLEKIRSGA